MIEIIFESHATSIDNENHLASGWNDVDLSKLGKKQAKELGLRYKDQNFNAIFCSDLKRAYHTAEIAFIKRFPVIQDKRLRECNYGDLTKYPSDEVNNEKIKYINKPFPHGESYTQTNIRMKDFLESIKTKYTGKKIMIIGHKATQYGLDYWINGKRLEDLLSIPFKWQPGWKCVLNYLAL